MRGYFSRFTVVRCSFLLWFGWWKPVFMGRMGSGGVATNFVGLCSLVIFSSTIPMYVGIGPYFGDSHKKNSLGKVSNHKFNM